MATGFVPKRETCLMYKVMWLEWFKLTKRLAAWGIFFAFLALQVVFYGGRYYKGHEHPGVLGFPDALPDVLTGGTSLASVFVAVLVALTVSSEFEWRVCRQNIIDGLSKSRWFGGKLLSIRGCQEFCVRAGFIDQSLNVYRSPNWIAS